ncbi:MAG: hypothetical protein RJQ14_06655 [Marinoscillum sp.]
MKLFIVFCFSVFILLGVLLINPDLEPVVHNEKINGVSLVNPFEQIDSAEMSDIKRLRADWVAIIPFGFSNQGEPEVHYNHDRQWWGERVDGCAELVRLAHLNGFNVMLKPHVWMRGNWIGDFDLNSESDWKTWEANYAEYILTYARQAEAMNVEMLCIATELKQVVLKRPDYWPDLIDKIREVYHGELTYAANWDNYQNVSFWSALDFIGIDAYFPLVHSETPDLQGLKKAWKPLIAELKSYGENLGKPILFAEYGYMSANGAAGNHWEIGREATVNLEAQQIAYEALYQSLWEEEWFAGGFLWKWHFGENIGGENNSRFTPQGKPVEATIAKWYGHTTSRSLEAAGN